MEEFTLSRVMRFGDYVQLGPEVSFVDLIQSCIVPPHPYQHTHRRWEQALAWRAFTLWTKANCKEPNLVTASDWGCGVGMFPAMLVSVGVKVDMFEDWEPMYKMTTRAEGDESSFVHRQMTQVLCNSTGKGEYNLLSEPLLGQLGDTWRNKYDVSVCISTLEHIADRDMAFRQLCQTVKPGGLLFLTMDFSGDGGSEESYIGADCRSCMYTEKEIQKLGRTASEFGFSYFGGEPDWSWADECRMVNNYGFSSLTMVRNG